jgi:hypothetical protein
MNKTKVKYRQCLLTNRDKSQVTWIPSSYAIKGKCIRIKEDDGWFVESVGKNEITSQEAIIKESEHRTVEHVLS